MLLRIHPTTPMPRLISKAVEILRNGGILIYPTDSVYGLGCDMMNKKAVERIAKLKHIAPEKAKFSILCHDLSQVSEFAKIDDTSLYKIMRKNLPGPFTFILNASRKVPKILENKKRTIGIRVPNHNIVCEIVKELGNPIFTTSIRDEDVIIEYTTDPELIYERYQDAVDAVIDGGFGNIIPTTVIDCTGDEMVIIRQGLGELIF